TCESPGPVGARRLPPARWDREALVWREHAPVSCESVSDGYEVDVPVRLDAGPQELGVGDSRFVFEVAEHPPDVCPARGTLPDGTACDQDCECTPGSRCLAARDAGCARTCAQPCAVDPTGDTPACGSGATCALDERLGAFVCAPSAAPECDAMRPCGRGQSCELSGRCTWSLPASPSDGSCTSSADCPTGKDCVLRWDHTLRCGLRCGPAGRCPAGACDLDGSCDYGDGRPGRIIAARRACGARSGGCAGGWRRRGIETEEEREGRPPRSSTARFGRTKRPIERGSAPKSRQSISVSNVNATAAPATLAALAVGISPPGARAAASTARGWASCRAPGAPGA
ncbi:MAG: hypothetical protein ACK6CU_09660, partial [Deltaproteobacteria bacterium]